jgi:hypothetical protein
MDTNKIEKALLEKELKVISEKLIKIGNDITDVFSKYGAIDGDHAVELHDYIVNKVLYVDNPFFKGYTTIPQPNTSLEFIPDCIKDVILKWAVEEFIGKLQTFNL